LEGGSSLKLFNDFQNILITSLSLGELIRNLLVAFICGLIVSSAYRISYKGPNYSPTFIQSSILLSLITALVIMVIGNNLARAFGLVGAMSIIRFRTAVKDTEDIVFIFFSLAVGMAAGVGLRVSAIVGTLFISLILIVLARGKYAVPKRSEFLLQFHFDENGDDETAYLEVLKKYCKYHRLVNMQSVGTANLYELSFYITLKNKDEGARLIQKLNKLPHLHDVKFFYDEEPIK